MRSRLTLVLVATLAAAACGRPALLRVLDAQHRTSNAVMQFENASEATNRAVMARTDVESRQSAAEARQARTAVQDDIDALKPLLEGLRFAQETGLLAEFEKNFAEYRQLDDTILDLAVEQTNTKARALSFGEGREAADAVRDALAEAAPESSGDWRARALANGALAAVRELQALQAPHIEEPDDRAMDTMEARMSDVAARATAALSALQGAVPPASRAKVSRATAAFERFMILNRQIIELSRRNSNVRSLALVMEQKGMRTAACERAIQALSAALSERASTASR